MAPELFANLAESTLASPYTSGGTSITVVSAALFPSTGVFRIRLGNLGKTIWRVDSVAGAVFTGAAEAFDANALAGDTAKLVGTKAVAERFIQEPSTSEIAAYAGPAGARRWGPIWPLTPLDQSAWSWVNQSTAVITQAGGIVSITKNNEGENYSCRVHAIPASPYTITMAVRFFGLEENFNITGMVLRESSSGKLFTWGPRSEGERSNVNSRKQNSPTSHNSEPVNRPISPPGLWFFRIVDNNTNLLFQYSADGKNFATFFTEARLTWLTSGADQVGIFMANYNGTGPDPILSVLSWEEA